MLVSGDMSNVPDPPPNLPLTPCIGICWLDDDGYCAGCRRTGEEIARWPTMSNPERLRVMEVLLPGRMPS